jgi:hypothetical protein
MIRRQRAGSLMRGPLTGQSELLVRNPAWIEIPSSRLERQHGKIPAYDFRRGAISLRASPARGLNC